jgi:hypothetical protein
LEKIYREKDHSDKDRLIQLYHEFNCNRIDYNTIKWRTVQFFTTLNSAILTASVALIAYKGTNHEFHTKVLLALLPFNLHSEPPSKKTT